VGSSRHPVLVFLSQQRCSAEAKGLALLFHRNGHPVPRVRLGPRGSLSHFCHCGGAYYRSESAGYEVLQCLRQNYHYPESPVTAAVLLEMRRQAQAVTPMALFDQYFVS